MTYRKKCIVKLKRWVINYKALLLCIFAFFCIIISPWLFTKPAYFKSLVFYDAGTIGDTIGGITAPFIGFTSIILLFWTLNEQVKINKVQKRFNNKIIHFNKQQIQFNLHQMNYTERQDKFNDQQIQFNDQQKKFNDATRILSIETFISKIDNDIRFGYSTPTGIAEGRGLSDISLLNNIFYKRVGIAEKEFVQLLDSIDAFNNNLNLLKNLVTSDETKLETIQLDLIKANLLFYYNKMEAFYKMIKDNEITIYPIKNDKKNDHKNPVTHDKDELDNFYKKYRIQAEEKLRIIQKNKSELL